MSDIVSREKIFDTVVKEAGAFYDLVIKISISCIGATFFFTEKICVDPLKWTLILLFFGWGSLVCTIGLVAWVRFKNIKSGTLVLEGKIIEAIAIDKNKGRVTGISLVFLIIGILCFLVFGAVNFYYTLNKKEKAMDDKKVVSRQQIRQDSIPCGIAVKNNPIAQEELLKKSIPFAAAVQTIVNETDQTGKTPTEAKASTSPESSDVSPATVNVKNIQGNDD